METTTSRETIDLGGGIRVELDAGNATITVPPSGALKQQVVVFAPRSRQDANRMSIALKKASRRLQGIGNRLPDER